MKKSPYIVLITALSLLFANGHGAIAQQHVSQSTITQRDDDPAQFTTFAEWCLSRESLAPGARHTIEVLLQKVSEEECDRAQTALEALTSINLYNEEITDLSPLVSLPGLTNIYLERNQITDVSPLASLPNLTWIELRHNQVSDVSPLATITALDRLDLRDNQITDVLPLVQLPTFVTLMLAGNPIPMPEYATFEEWCLNQETFTPDIRKTIRVLLNRAETEECDRAQSVLDELTELYLSERILTDISPLVTLTNLTKLVLDGNRVTDISPLSSLTHLTHLSLDDNFNVIDISAVANLHNLEILNLNANEVEDISPLMNLTQLVNLNLGANRIKDASPLKNLHRLTTLHLGGRVSVIYHLSEWSLLVRTNENQIDASALATLTTLKTLDLSHNGITDISGLSDLTQLTTLNLSDNQATDLSPLQNLVHLQDLNLSYQFDNWPEPTYLPPALSKTNEAIVPITPNRNGKALTHVSQQHRSQYGRSQRNLSEWVLSNRLKQDESSNSPVEQPSLLLSPPPVQWPAVPPHFPIRPFTFPKPPQLDISPLAGLTNLTTLKLRNNYIMDVDALATLTKLTTLQLSNNQITDVSPLAALTALQRLILADNQITDLWPLVGLYNLVTLEIGGNPASDRPCPIHLEPLCTGHSSEFTVERELALTR